MSSNVEIVCLPDLPMGDEKGILIPYIEASVTIKPEGRRITKLVIAKTHENTVKDYMWNKVPYQGLYVVNFNGFNGKMSADKIVFLS